MKKIGELECENGARVKEFPELLTYRRHREATTYKVGYTIGQDEYILDGMVRSRTPTDNKDNHLSEDDSRPIVQEIREQLRKKGFSVSANISEAE